jgi:hypothetical protein
MSIKKSLCRILVISMLFLLFTVPDVAKALDTLGTDFLINGEPEHQVYPSTAYNPELDQYLVVWQNDRPGFDDIFGQRLWGGGRLEGPMFTVIGGVGYERRYPDVVYNSNHNEYLVVWEELDGGWLKIKGIRVSAWGEVIPPVIEISTGPALKNCEKPVVAYASHIDKYVVVWTRFVQMGISYEIEGQVLSGTGALEGGNFLISASPVWNIDDRNADIAYNRSRNEFMVVWEQHDTNTSDTDIYGRRLEGNGTPIGPGPHIINSSTDIEDNPSVAAIPTVPNEGKYLVAWVSPYSLGNDNIYVQRYKGDGSQDSAIRMISSSPLSDSNPAVAGSESAGQFLVTWTQPPGGGTLSNIKARTFSLDAEVMGPETSIGGRFSGWTADNSAVTNGRLGDYLVVYNDQTLYTPDNEIFGQLLGNRQYLPVVVR